MILGRECSMFNRTARIARAQDIRNASLFTLYASVAIHSVLVLFSAPITTYVESLHPACRASRSPAVPDISRTHTSSLCFFRSSRPSSPRIVWARPSCRSPSPSSPAQNPNLARQRRSFRTTRGYGSSLNLRACDSACPFLQLSAYANASASPRTAPERAFVYPAIGAFLGAWAGVIPIGLDWDRPWQVRLLPYLSVWLSHHLHHVLHRSVNCPS